MTPCIAHIINLCISQGVFPLKMQTARVTVLHKKGDKNDVGNYRPVSILPVLLKSLEKLFLKRLTRFDQKHTIIVDCQYGFRQGLGTEPAFIDQKEYILSQLDRVNMVLRLFIDLTKAFDHINHNLLVRKVERYGIRGVAASFIKSYLKDRNQIVALHGFSSEPCRVKSGVPQGSILGPFLFNIYVNDIIGVSSCAKFIIYADDTSIFFHGKLAHELIVNANSTLRKLESWTEQNSLKISGPKTKEILFRARNKAVIIDNVISLNSAKVEIVPSVKTLGFIFHEHLSWDERVILLTKKLSQIVCLLYRHKHILQPNIILLIYNTLFSSRLNYCHLV